MKWKLIKARKNYRAFYKLIFCILFCIITTLFFLYNGNIPGWGFIIFFVFVLSSACRIFRSENNLHVAIKRNHELIERQRNSPFKILYLRNFRDDGIKIETYNLPFSETTYEALVSNFELSISLKVAPIGHFIAIGAPSKSGDVGADRFEIDNIEWQGYVSDNMKKASMILFRPKCSKCLLWEFETIIENSYLEKTVICVDSRKNYKEFRKTVAHIKNLPKNLFFTDFIYFNSKKFPKTVFAIHDTPVAKKILFRSEILRKSLEVINPLHNKRAMYACIVLSIFIIIFVVFLNQTID